MMQNNIIPRNDEFIDNKVDNFQNYTLIEIDNKAYAIKSENVLEIVKIMELEHPNGILSCILGIIKYREEPVGVIDLREVFQKERIIYNLSARIIILRCENSTCAIVCDKVSDIKKIENNKIKPMPYQSDGIFYEGIYNEEGQNIYIADISGILEYINSNFDKFINKENKLYIVNDEKSKKVLKDRKNALIQIDNDELTSISLYDRGVSFIINNVKYYINMASVKEFYKVKNSKFIKIPCTPDFIFGLINIKGEYITVLDIRRFYNHSNTIIKEKSTIIILNSQEFKIGVLADEICESMNVDFDEIVQTKLQKQEDGKMREFVKDDEIYQVLDIEQLLKDEKLAIA